MADDIPEEKKEDKDELYEEDSKLFRNEDDEYEEDVEDSGAFAQEESAEDWEE